MYRFWRWCFARKNHNKPSVEQKKFEEIKNYIDEYYYFETNSEAEIQGIYKGLVASLGDPYSGYFLVEENEELKKQFVLDVAGIGVHIEQNFITGAVMINGVVQDCPAAMAGLQAGDYIQYVDDIWASEIPLDILVSNHISGAIGIKSGGFIIYI